MSTPVPSTRDEAVEWARKTRGVRDALISAVEEGRLDLPAAVSRASADPATTGLRVVTLLESVPGVGKVAARRALRGLGVDDHRPVGSLAGEDVVALAEVGG